MHDRTCSNASITRSARRPWRAWGTVKVETRGGGAAKDRDRGTPQNNRSAAANDAAVCCCLSMPNDERCALTE